MTRQYAGWLAQQVAVEAEEKMQSLEDDDGRRAPRELL
jgi:NTP pyrophosphatase (non-canonical NTP hydrolase)